MYIKRNIEKEIKQRLFQGKIIVVYGARQVGKTTLVKKIADDLGKPYTYLNCDNLDILSKFADANNSEALKLVMGGNRLVIVDEAQRVTNIGIKLKLMADTFPDIQIIATGSSSFELANEIKEPLTGRNFEYWLFPLSLNEIFKDDQSIEADRKLESLLVYGSYPEVYLLESDGLKAERVKYLAANYTYQDILKFGNIKSPDVLLKLLQALALQIGQEVSYNELANTVGVGKTVISDYIQVLQKAFIVFRLAPYSGNLRKAIGKLRKIYFFDLGIRNAIINNQNPISLRDDVGKLWENFIISEKYKQQTGLGTATNYYFWRTYDKQEVDLVEMADGKLTGMEIKWGNKSAKPPKAWTALHNSSWKLINRENYFNEMIKKP